MLKVVIVTNQILLTEKKKIETIEHLQPWLVHIVNVS